MFDLLDTNILENLRHWFSCYACESHTQVFPEQRWTCPWPAHTAPCTSTDWGWIWVKTSKLESVVVYRQIRQKLSKKIKVPLKFEKGRKGKRHLMFKNVGFVFSYFEFSWAALDKKEKCWLFKCCIMHQMMKTCIMKHAQTWEGVTFRVKMKSMCHSIMKACSVLHGNQQSISYTTHWLLGRLKKGIP